MATERRLIDADALLAKFKEHRDLYAPSWESFNASSIHVKSRVDEIDTCMADVINAPTVDAVEVVHGRWIHTEIEDDEEWGGTWHKWTCSNCDFSTGHNPNGTNYCPNCGAKMDGDGNG